MAKKTNMKSVRLSDQVMDYVINFEGEGFNQKFENLVLFCMEQEESKKQRITLLDQQIAKQYKKLSALQQISSEIETAFLLILRSKSVKGERSSFISTLDRLDTASAENQKGRMGSLQGEHPS